MNEKQMQHGADWQGENLAGWYLSEKMNGCRAFWDGKTLWSRSGIPAKLPAAWIEELPAVVLDCELYDGIGGLYRCGAALRYGRFTPSMRLIVFDAPGAAGDWPERMQYTASSIKGSAAAVCVAWRLCESNNDALQELKKVQDRGGEGLMLRSPNLPYRAGITRKLLKIKTNSYLKMNLVKTT